MDSEVRYTFNSFSHSFTHSASLYLTPTKCRDFPGGPVVKNPSAYAGDMRDMGSISRSGRSPGEGNGNPLQYTCQEISMYRGAWQTTVHENAES